MGVNGSVIAERGLLLIIIMMMMMTAATDVGGGRTETRNSHFRVASSNLHQNGPNPAFPVKY